jgi:hypothetical protein
LTVPDTFAFADGLAPASVAGATNTPSTTNADADIAII